MNCNHWFLVGKETEWNQNKSSVMQRACFAFLFICLISDACRPFPAPDFDFFSLALKFSNIQSIYKSVNCVVQVSSVFTIRQECELFICFLYAHWIVQFEYTPHTTGAESERVSLKSEATNPILLITIWTKYSMWSSQLISILFMFSTFFPLLSSEKYFFYC